eukprot:2034633-Amphidinium_carterae.1
MFGDAKATTDYNITQNARCCIAVTHGRTGQSCYHEHMTALGRRMASECLVVRAGIRKFDAQGCQAFD